MSAGDGKPDIHPPLHEKDMVESPGTSHKVATAEKLLSDSGGLKLSSLSTTPRPLTANTFGMISLTSSDKLAPAGPVERKEIHTGSGVGDFVANFVDAGARNLASIGDQTLRSIRDPLSTVRDIGTAGKTIVENPSVIAKMYTETKASMQGDKGAASAGGSWGVAFTTIGALFVGGKNAVSKAENRAVEGANSIEQKLAQTSRLLNSAEAGGVRAADNMAVRLGTGNAVGELPSKLGTRVDGLALKPTAIREPVLKPPVKVEPVVRTPEPVVRTPEPVVRTPEPVVRTPEPVVRTPEPVVRTPEPVLRTPEPVIKTGGEPAIKTGGEPAIKTGGEPVVKTGGEPAIKTGGEPAIKTGGEPAVKKPVSVVDDAATVKKPVNVVDDAATVKKPVNVVDDAATVKKPDATTVKKPNADVVDDAVRLKDQPLKPKVDLTDDAVKLNNQKVKPKVDEISTPRPKVEPVVEPKPHVEPKLDTVKTHPSNLVDDLNPRTNVPKPVEPVVPRPEPAPIRPNEPVRPIDASPTRPVPTDRTTPAAPDFVRPKDAPALVNPADTQPIRNLTRELDKLPATVPGATDAQTKLTLFKENPSISNYKDLSDSLRTLSKNAPEVQQQVQVALESARQALVLRSVSDTSQALAGLLSTADARVAALPPGVRAQAETLVQQMRAASQGLMGAELLSGQRTAVEQLKQSTFELSQLLQKSKGAQSALENSLLQVSNAQKDLVAANYLVRTGDTLSGQTVDFLKSYWRNIVGAGVVALELRTILGNLAQKMEFEQQKLLEKQAQEKSGETGNEQGRARQASEEGRSQHSSLFLNSKEPALKPQFEPETHREQIRKQNLSMYGVDLDYTYYQRGLGQVSVDDSQPSVQAQKPAFRINTNEQQDKTSVPRFDYVKTRMPATRIASSDHPYAGAPMAFKPGVRNQNNRGSGASNLSTDPANSLVAKNYAFVVAPGVTGSAASRYGGPNSGAEAVEKQNPDRIGGGSAANTQQVAAGAVSATLASNTTPQASSGAQEA